VPLGLFPGVMYDYLKNEKASAAQVDEDEGVNSDDEWLELQARHCQEYVSPEVLPPYDDPYGLKMANSLRTQNRSRLYFRFDILWPIMFNYVCSIHKRMGGKNCPPIVVGSLDDVWLGKGEVMCLMMADPFKDEWAHLVDQELVRKTGSLSRPFARARLPVA
jgi:hypothetical protein